MLTGLMDHAIAITPFQHQSTASEIRGKGSRLQITSDVKAFFFSSKVTGLWTYSALIVQTHTHM
jgi:hypothetical protein